MEGKNLGCQMEFLLTGKAHIDITPHLYLTELTMKLLMSTQVNSFVYILFLSKMKLSKRLN